ncbi:MAG: carbohydrate deacetylase [Carboxydocellales bacterium]
MKYLIVNADDFGFSPGVNGGILQAHREGIVSSTTVMVNLPLAGIIVEAVAQCSALGAGVHLNITYGKPVLRTEQVPSLVDSQGNFIRPELGVDRFRPAEVEAEWRAQLALFQSWGFRPTHLDSHHHVHTWPGLRELVAQIAREFALPVRFTDQPTRELLVSTTVPVTDYFVGDFYGAGATTAHLQAILQDLKPGVTELMCHPAIVDQPLTAKSSYTWPRSGELSALIAPEVRDLLNNQGIKLINYADLIGILT